jgi:hypothetical protein
VSAGAAGVVGIVSSPEEAHAAALSATMLLMMTVTSSARAAALARGNPAGRPRSSKNKFADAFWADLCEIWEAKGKAALEAAVLEDPVRFIAIAAQVLPKDVNVKHDANEAFLQLWKLISDGQAEAALAGIKQGEEQPVH